MSKALTQDTRFLIPWDGMTEDGQQLIIRVLLPKGTDRRRVKRTLRAVLNRLGIRDYQHVIKEMGWSKYV